MPKRSTGEAQDLNEWMLLQHTRDLIFRAEDRLLTDFGLTAEQYEVLLAIESLDEPVRATDIARWLGHKVNTVSMIVERMVRADLVTRLRDLPDRREVRVVMTSKGERVFQTAHPAVSQLIADIWSSLPGDERRVLITLLQKLRDRALDQTVARADTPTTGRHWTGDDCRLA